MPAKLKRRAFLGAASAAVAATMVPGRSASQEPKATKGIKIIGISCSPRKGKNTATAVRACLEAAREAGAEVELIELAGMKINGSVAAGVPLEPGERDDFPQLVPKLSDPKVAGVVVGSPVYFGGVSSLCKAFLDRCVAFRRAGFALHNKVGGAIAVGGARNGGQELTVQSIHTALFGQEMVIVGTARPTVRIGGTLWSHQGDVSADEFGLQTARDLGRRVVEVALRITS